MLAFEGEDDGDNDGTGLGRGRGFPRAADISERSVRIVDLKSESAFSASDLNHTRQGKFMKPTEKNISFINNYELHIR